MQLRWVLFSGATVVVVVVVVEVVVVPSRHCAWKSIGESLELAAPRALAGLKDVPSAIEVGGPRPSRSKGLCSSSVESSWSLFDVCAFL